MALSQQDLQLKTGETAQQYDLRIAGLRGDTKTELANTQAARTPLYKAQAPTNASQVTNTSGFQMPNLKPTVGDPASAIAANSSVSALLKQQQELFAAQNERDTKQMETNNSWLKDFLSGPTRQETRQDLEKDMGVKKLQDQITGLITESEALTTDYNDTVAKRDEHVAVLEQNSLGALERGVDSRVADAERFYATKLNQKSSNINAKAAVIQMLNGNLNSARDYINQAVQDFTADKKDRLDAFLTFQQLNSDLLSNIDTRYNTAFQSAITAAQEDYNNTLTEKTTIGELMLTYNAAGAGITLNDSLSDAYRKAGSVTLPGEDGGFTLSDGQTRYDKFGNVIATAAGGDGINSVSPEYGSIIRNVSSLFGAQEYDEKQAALVQALNSGDTTGAYAMISNAVGRNLDGADATRFRAANADLYALSELRGALQEYVDAGGDMGYFKGTWSDITRKVGQLATDPQFARLATRLDASFQRYRVNMTGAAFGPNESRDYQKVNPSSKANLDLNLSVIDGLGDYLQMYVESTVESQVPGAMSLRSGGFMDGGGVDESSLSDDEAWAIYQQAQ